MLKIISANLIITVALLEACSSVLLKDRIQRVFSEYLTTSTYNFGRRSYPRWHFSKNKKRGFDIKKDSSPVISSQPREIEPYFVFGNNIGCFDEIPISSQKYHVYLAGDSFTWGYAPLNKKFGTLLEDKLQKPVAACGVSHTGQIHQFSKFSDITNQLGYYPEHVIVNVYKNDIANDFSHPHTTVIKGYQVDYVLVRKKDQLLTREEISIAKLLKKYDEESKRKSNTKLGKWDPRKYSATAVLASEVVLKPILNFILPKISKPSDSLKIYEVSHKESDFYPIHSEIANRNRNAILEWINHSKKHSYSLIFADLMTQPIKRKLPIGSQIVDQSFCDFITSKGANCYSFAEYLSKNHPNQTWDSIVWKNNSHFNFKGNRLYSEFLSKSLQGATK